MSGDENIETQVNAVVQDDRRMLALLMDNLPGMVYRCRNDADWTLEFVSQGCLAVTGYLPEELVRSPLHSLGALTVEEDRSGVNEIIYAALAEGRPYQLQYRLEHRVLGRRWVWEQGRGVVGPNGALLCLEGYITDITERKVALERLEQSEAHFRSLAENALDVIFRYELLPEPHLAYVSPAIEKITGYKVEEYYADRYKLQMLSLPEEWEKVNRFLAGDIDNSGPLQIRWQHRDGSTIWTEQRISLVRDETGKVISAEGVIRDITERKRMEDALQRKVAEEAALVEMLRAILDPQISIDQVAQIVLNHARALTGSVHGFVSSIDPTTLDNIGHTLTEMMGGECKIAQESRNVAFKIGPDGRYPGLWGEALNTRRSFFTNAPSRHPASAWSPPGHIVLKSLLSVPAVRGDDLLGQIVLANAPDGFTQADMEIVERLAGFYGLYLQQWRLGQRLKESAAQLRRHNRILSVVADAASRFLMTIDWDQEVNALLAGLGQALDANRAFVFENFTLEDGELAARRIYSWQASDQDEAGRPKAAGDSYVRAGLARWVEVLGSGRAIAGQVNDFPQSERELLTRQGVQSLLAMPIFTGYDWYGYLGFGNNVEAKEWSTPEVDALQAAAGILGAAIERRKAETALLWRTQDLERFEKLVVGRELKMIELKQRIETLEAELKALGGSER